MKQKGLRKLVSMILAVVMCFGVCGSAFADVDSEQGGNGSITINNVIEDYTYNLYKIFELTGANPGSDGTYANVAYTIDEDWVNFFIASEASGADYLVEQTAENKNSETYAGCETLTYNGTVYFINITEHNVAAFADDALTYALSLTTADYSYVAESTGSIKITGLELGYYLVYPYGATELNENSSGSICSLDSTDPDAEINIKADYPTIDKAIKDENGEVEDGSVYVGQELTYEITGNVPDTTGYESYTYKVSDKMSEGLTFGGTNTVKVTFTNGTNTVTIIENGSDGENAETESYTLTDEGDADFTLTIDMTKYQEYVGYTVTITYTATVNSNAVTVISENEATLEYSDDPEDSESKAEVTDIEKVYSAKIVVDKYEEGNTTKKLAGAKFKLYRYTDDSKTTKEYYIVDSDDGSVSWGTETEATEFTTDDEGAVTIEGLEDGTYYLVETEAPAGYNLLTEDKEITLSNSVEDLENSADANNDGSNEDEIATKLTSTAEVSNNTGTTLPGTGGIGTTIFYVVGVVLMFGAAVMLVAKVRIGKEK